MDQLNIRNNDMYVWSYVVKRRFDFHEGYLKQYTFDILQSNTARYCTQHGNHKVKTSVRHWTHKDTP